MRGRAAALALLVGLVITSATVAQEQAASPVATPVVTTDPTGCTVQPRPSGFLAALVESPPAPTTPIPSEGIPEGTPMDEPMLSEVTATVTMLIACVNAGDVLRAFALYDDAYLLRLLDPEAVLSTEIADELVASFTTPEPVPQDRHTRLVSLPVTRVMADGRVAVVTETQGGLADEDDDTELGLLILARSADGRWLIVDGRTDIDRGELPTA